MTPESVEILDRIKERMFDGVPLHQKEVNFAGKFSKDELVEADRWLGVMMAEYPPVFAVEIDTDRGVATITDGSVRQDAPRFRDRRTDGLIGNSRR